MLGRIHPGTVVDLQSGEEWCGEDIRKEATRRASSLIDIGVVPRAKVIVLHGGTASFFMDILAIWHAGACAVCLNSHLTDEELRKVVSVVDPIAILTDSGRMTVAGIDVRTLCLAEAGRSSSAEPRAASSNLDDDALILFTSGTTSEPKGVVHSFRSLLARIALNRHFIGIQTLSRTLCVLPTHFGHGLIGNCLTPLLSGQTLILAPDRPLEAAGRLGRLLDDHGVTFMSSVPSFWRLVFKIGSPPPAEGTLRRIQVGSAPLSARLWQSIIDWSGVRDVANVYGITETANWLAGASAETYAPMDGVVGQMWGGFAAVKKEDGSIVSHGTGELLVQSPSLMTEYYKRPDLTSASLKNGWFHTGDIARIDSDDSIYLVGRQKYEINRAGLKVHPEDIDVLLERHEAVKEACAFSVPDELSGETVGVAVTLVDGTATSTATLRQWCFDQLTREKVPEHWFVLDELPTTPRGKLDRGEVARRCLNIASL